MEVNSSAECACETEEDTEVRALVLGSRASQSSAVS